MKRAVATPELIARAAEELARTGGVKKAAYACGMHVTTLHGWRHRYPVIADAWPRRRRDVRGAP